MPHRKHNTTGTTDVIATLQQDDGTADATPAMKARQSFPPLHTMPPVAYTRLALDSLPLSWTLCTLAVDPGERYLLVMRAGREHEPLLVRILLPEQVCVCVCLCLCVVYVCVVYVCVVCVVYVCVVYVCVVYVCGVCVCGVYVCVVYVFSWAVRH